MIEIGLNAIRGSYTYPCVAISESRKWLLVMVSGTMIEPKSLLKPRVAGTATLPLAAIVAMSAVNRNVGAPLRKDASRRNQCTMITSLQATRHSLCASMNLAEYFSSHFKRKRNALITSNC
jgi:hypothetical protein